MDDEQLERSLGHVAFYRTQVRKTLESPHGKLLVAVKQASAMLNELRTTKLPPQPYYELYNACFDTLSQLEEYLIEDHKNHHLADVYEVVQYTATVLPRLYLMITVGTAFLATPEAPRQEVLKDMLEMSRGIQSPLRGLFLRYYLAQRTGPYLETTTRQELEFSVQFTLTNFIEMNKLWVRYQHDGLSKGFDQRTEERKQLETIVGSSILRLSQLDNMDLAFFGNLVLPALLGQVVQCHDRLAQEYILDIVIQVFPAEFHLETLNIFLDCLKSLVKEASVPMILQASMKRITEFAVEVKEKEAEKLKRIENEAREEAAKKEQEADGKKDSTNPAAEKDKKDSGEEVTDNKDEKTKDSESETNGESTVETNQEGGGDAAKDLNGGDTENDSNSEFRPESDAEQESTITAIFAPVVAEYMRIITAQQVSSKDRAMLITSLIELCEVSEVPLSLHDLFEYLCAHSIEETPEVENLLLSLFDSKETSLAEMLGLLRDFPQLLSSQSKETRHIVAEHVVTQFLENRSAGSIELTKQVLDLITLFLTSASGSASGVDPVKMRQFIHLLVGETVESSLELLMMAHSKFRKSGSSVVAKTTAIVVCQCLEILRGGHSSSEVSKVLKFCNQACHDLATVGDMPLSAYRLFITCARAANDIGAEDASYELFVQALSIYEEFITESGQQIVALAIIIQALQQTSVFTSENFEPLAQRCLQYGQRMMKKPDQCRSLLLAAHLYWDNDYADARRVEETLARALRSADSVMDSGMSIELFLDVLDTNLYFLGNNTPTVTVESVNSIITLIKENLKAAERDGLSEGQPSLAALQQRWLRIQEFVNSEGQAFPRFESLSLADE